MPRRRFRPAQAFTILPSLRQASPSSFLQNLSFELREYGKQTGHRATGWCGQIQGLGQTDEADAEMIQFLKCGQQICYRSAQRSRCHTSTTSISRSRAAWKDGQTRHTESTFWLDGNSYPVLGGTLGDALSAHQLESHSLEVTVTRASILSARVKITISEDGNVMTMQCEAVIPQGT